MILDCVLHPSILLQRTGRRASHDGRTQPSASSTSCCTTEDAIVAAPLSTPVPEPSPDTVKPKEEPECDAGEAVAPAGNATLLRGDKVSLDNVVVVVSQKASSQAQLPHVIDTIMEKLDASESSVLLSQAKLHPRLDDFLKDMMGDDEFSPSDFASADETAMDELVNLIQWLADRVVDDQPHEPREDASHAVPDVPSESTRQPAVPAGPREGEPWFFMRSFARVSKLHWLPWVGCHGSSDMSRYDSTVGGMGLTILTA